MTSPKESTGSFLSLGVRGKIRDKEIAVVFKLQVLSWCQGKKEVSNIEQNTFVPGHRFLMKKQLKMLRIPIQLKTQGN